MSASTTKTGFILIDKPTKMSSHAVIARLRRLSGIKKIGHAGTLDPLATGLLLVAIGRENTKRLSEFIKLDKEYRAEILLGASTASFDREQALENLYSGPKIKRKKIKEVLAERQKQTQQIPPAFSAKQINGERAYKLALKGKEPKLKEQNIKIYKLKIKRYRWPYLTIQVKCSSGTYIRSLAHDLGQDLGCGACLNKLSRTMIGNFKLKKAVQLNKLNNQNLSKYIKNPDLIVGGI